MAASLSGCTAGNREEEGGMAGSEPTMEILTQRLDHLERQNRRWKRAAAALALGIATVVLMGQARTTKRVVEAEQFVLLDRAGKPRAVLTQGSDGNIGLRFTDPAGRVRIALAMEADGRPGMELSDASGARRVWLFVGDDGSPHITLLDAAERKQAFLGLGPDGTVGLILASPPSKANAVLAIVAGKRGGLELADPSGKVIFRAP